MISLISGVTIASETSLSINTLTLAPAVVSLAFINVYKIITTRRVLCQQKEVSKGQVAGKILLTFVTPDLE